MEILRFGGLADVDSSAVFCCHGGRYPALAGQVFPDGLPIVSDSLLAEIPLNEGQEVIRQHRYEKMSLHPAVFPVEIGAQAQFAFKAAEGRFHTGQHHIKLPQFLVGQVGSVAANVIGTAEMRLQFSLPFQPPLDGCGIFGGLVPFNIDIVEAGKHWRIAL